jgi:hypothetical protein
MIRMAVECGVDQYITCYGVYTTNVADSSKLPASTTVAYARKWRCRGKLKLKRKVSIPGVMCRKFGRLIISDTFNGKANALRGGKAIPFHRASMGQNRFMTLLLPHDCRRVCL